MEAVYLLPQWYRSEGFASAYDWLKCWFQGGPPALPAFGVRGSGGGLDSLSVVAAAHAVARALPDHVWAVARLESDDLALRSRRLVDGFGYVQRLREPRPVQPRDAVADLETGEPDTEGHEVVGA